VRPIALVLALLDVRDPLPLTTRIHQGHVLSAAFGVALLGLLTTAILLGVSAPTVSRLHLLTATAAITMTAIAVIGLTFRAARKRFRLSWDSVGIVAVYVGTVWMLATAGGE